VLNDELRLPEGWRHYRRGAQVEIVYGRQSLASKLLEATVALLFNVYGVIFWVQAIQAGDFLQQSWLMIFFALLLFAVIPLGMTYHAAMVLCNKTHLLLSPDLIAVSDRPIPGLHNKKIPIADIRQIQVEKYQVGTRMPREYHKLCAITRSGDKIMLLGELQTARQGRFLQQEIEHYLPDATPSITENTTSRQTRDSENP